jgi:hypothetical protein
VLVKVLVLRKLALKWLVVAVNLGNRKVLVAHVLVRSVVLYGVLVV